MIISFPHFLYADPKYQLDTLWPDKSKHESLIKIESLTSLPMESSISNNYINIFLFI